MLDRAVRLMNLKQLLEMKNTRLAEMEAEAQDIHSQMAQQKLNHQLLLLHSHQQESDHLEEELRDLGTFQENLQESMATQFLRRRQAEECTSMVKEDIYSQLLQIEAIKQEQNDLSLRIDHYELTHGTSLCYYQILTTYD